MTQCEIPPVPELHPALAGRFSPVRFRGDVTVAPACVDILLEAARRAPSAGNSQPWRFIVGVRGDSVHRRIVRHLARSSSVWATPASMIVVNIAEVGIEDAPDWQNSEFAVYDLGQAVAHMSIQGLAMGMDSHQFRAFDREAVSEEFGVPAHFEVVSMTAFGTADHEPGEIPAPGTSRDRRSREEITWARDPGCAESETPCHQAR